MIGKTPRYFWWKRPLDLTLTLLAAPLWLPLLVVVGVVVRVGLGSPVFFRQLRPGLLERPFLLRKFRTMREGPGADAARLTPLGRWLRATSLDELPELLLVLRGEMSLVGPRPLLMDYLDKYDATQRRRHLVRPGLTGLAQICGRNACSWEEQFRLDVEYVDNCSFLLDIRILWRTVGLVLQRRGVSQPGQATRMPFQGSDRTQ
ncbi:sugar transferase [Megalodesulfovibrio paquesii]